MVRIFFGYTSWCKPYGGKKGKSRQKKVDNSSHSPVGTGLEPAAAARGILRSAIRIWIRSQDPGSVFGSGAIRAHKKSTTPVTLQR